MSQQQYDNRLSGALFKNDRKTSTSQPDYRGSITDENGKEYWVSAWIKQKRGGNDKFLSIALTEKDAQQQPVRSQSNNRDQDDFLNQNASTINRHRANPKDDMAGGPGNPPQPAADFDSFDDDIPF